MVYMSGNRSARNQASIVNRTNICGGNKKAGIVSRIGWFMQSNPTLKGAPQTLPIKCVPNRTVQVQQTGYRATISGRM